MRDDHTEPDADEVNPWTLVERAGAGLLVVDGDGRVSYANPSAGRLMGGHGAADALVGETVWSLLDESVTWPPPALDAEGRATFEVGIVGRGDSETPVELVVRPLADGAAVVTVRDVSSQRERHAVLGRARGRFEAIFERSNDAIFIFDPEAQSITEVNPRACELVGYSREELLALEPRAIHPHEQARFDEFVDSVLAEGSGFTTELGCYTKSGAVVPAEISAGLVDLDGRRQILASVRDVSLRHERQRELRRLAAAMEASTDGIAVLSAEETFVYLNRAFAAIYGYDRPDQLVGDSWRVLYDDERLDRLAWDVFPTVRERGQWRGELVGQRRDGESFPQELSLSRIDDSGIVCVVRDVTRRAVRDRRMDSLATVTRELLSADTHGVVADRAVEAVDPVVGLPVACVRQFDEEANRLTRVATSRSADRLLADRPAYDMDATYAGRAYRTGETVRNEVADDDPYADGAAESSLHLPLGEYGTLTIVTTDDEFRPHQRRIADVFAGTVAAAMDRASREQTLRENRRDLREQRDQLETLNSVSQVMLDVTETLVGAGSRSVVESTVCERLVDSDLYRQAWVGSVDASTRRVTPRAVAGVGSEHVRERGSVDLDAVEGGVVARAVDAGTVAVLGRVEMAASEFAPDQDIVQALAAVPIPAAAGVHGVLVLTATRPDIFGQRARAGLRTLGELIGFAITALRRRELLLSEPTVELSFELPDTDSVFAKVSRAHDCRCVHEGDVTRRDGTVEHRIRVDGATSDAVLADLEAVPDIEESRLVRETGDGCLLSVVFHDSPPEILVESGATLERIAAESGVSRITATAPRETEVRTIVDAVQARFPGAELVSKRALGTERRGTSGVRTRVGDALTERQRVVAAATVDAGYFEWPRESTAEEVAASLGISSSTFHEHLRKVERALFEALLAD